MLSVTESNSWNIIIFHNKLGYSFAMKAIAEESMPLSGPWPFPTYTQFPPAFLGLDWDHVTKSLSVKSCCEFSGCSLSSCEHQVKCLRCYHFCRDAACISAFRKAVKESLLNHFWLFYDIVVNLCILRS